MALSIGIIGAGACGLPATKVLLERGFTVEVFELGSDIGGLWRIDNDSGLSPAYASLHTNTSRTKTGFSDFPMPATYPDFPHHSQMLAYLEAYADRFALRRHIRFRHRVERVRQARSEAAPYGGVQSGGVQFTGAQSRLSPSGAARPGPTEAGPAHARPGPGPTPNGDLLARIAPGFEVTVRRLDDDTTLSRRFDAVLVASGHHWNPNWPAFPGTFDGIEMHSHAYRTPDFTAGKRVLVVGVGNSACDIACEVAQVAERTYVSTRRGAHVIPKYLLGRPLDLWLSPLTSRLPYRIQQSLFEALVLATRGRQGRYGFPTPEYRLGSEHPTISSNLLPLVRSGDIQPKPDVQELRGRSVRFADGSEEEIDVIIYATGYVASFPFLEDVEPVDNYLPLYRHIVHPDHPGLYFLGFVQPLGAIPPASEAQAQWAADILEGRMILPDADAMRAAIRREDEEREARYVDSKRHRMEVHYEEYVRRLREDRKRA